MTPFGQIGDGADVEEGVMAGLKLWLPAYLREVARQNGLEPGILAQPREWYTSATWDQSEQPKYPAIMVITPGLSGTPTKLNNEYRATWIIGVGIAVLARDDISARILARRYAAAVRTCVIQEPRKKFGEWVEGVDWIEEAYTDMPPENDRQMASARVMFNFDVQGVATVHPTGPIPNDPIPPDDEPYPEYTTLPDIDHVHVTVDRTEEVQ
jgi:hypothetical protein